MLLYHQHLLHFYVGCQTSHQLDDGVEMLEARC